MALPKYYYYYYYMALQFLKNFGRLRLRNNKFFYRVGLLAPRLTPFTLGDLGFSVRVYTLSQKLPL
jgi:hypothetical protein